MRRVVASETATIRPNPMYCLLRVFSPQNSTTQKITAAPEIADRQVCCSSSCFRREEQEWPIRGEMRHAKIIREDAMWRF